jgi:hypothetical protein
MIFGLVLSGITITTHKQVKKSERRDQATDLAEMGITYYQKLGEELISSAQAAVTTKKAQNINTNFCNEFTSLLKTKDGTKNVDSTNQYQLKLDTSTGKTTTCSDTLDKIKIVFNSTGINNTTEQKEIEGTFYVSKKTTGAPAPPVRSDFINYIKNTTYSSTSKVYYGDLTHNDQPKNKKIDSIAWFNSLNVIGNRTVTVNNLTIFNKINGVSMNSHSNITVNGDAIFLGPDPKPTPPSRIDDKQYICVTGTTYYKRSNGTIEVFSDFDKYFNLETNCKKTTPTTAIDQWIFDNNTGVNVNYNP